MEERLQAGRLGSKRYGLVLAAMNQYRASVVLGDHQIGIFFREIEGMGPGRWGVFKNGRNSIAPRFRDVTDVGLTSTKKEAAPLLAFERSSNTEEDDLAPLLWTNGKEGHHTGRRWKPNYRSKTWREKCDEASKLLRHEFNDARATAAIPSIEQLNILYFDPGAMIPNILCNSIGRSLRMNSGRSAVWQLEEYGWDERPQFNIRRAHITDWFRRSGGNCLIVGEENANVAERADGLSHVHTLWRWIKDGSTWVQRDEDEKECFVEKSRSENLQEQLDEAVRTRCFDGLDYSLLADLCVSDVVWNTKAKVFGRKPPNADTGKLGLDARPMNEDAIIDRLELIRNGLRQMQHHFEGSIDSAAAIDEGAEKLKKISTSINNCKLAVAAERTNIERILTSGITPNQLDVNNMIDSLMKNVVVPGGENPADIRTIVDSILNNSSLADAATVDVTTVFNKIGQRIKGVENEIDQSPALAEEIVEEVVQEFESLTSESAGDLTDMGLAPLEEMIEGLDEFAEEYVEGPVEDISGELIDLITTVEDVKSSTIDEIDNMMSIIEPVAQAIEFMKAIQVS